MSGDIEKNRFYQELVQSNNLMEKRNFLATLIIFVLCVLAWWTRTQLVGCLVYLPDAVADFIIYWQIDVILTASCWIMVGSLLQWKDERNKDIRENNRIMRDMRSGRAVVNIGEVDHAPSR
jgi:hypothetical protein